MIPFRTKRKVSVDSKVRFMRPRGYLEGMRANPYRPAIAVGYCAQGACRFSDMFGVTAGEAECARPCGRGTVRYRPFPLHHLEAVVG